jgi:ubiquinone/menaquinone biosynthesis C-methylase UbiE
MEPKPSHLAAEYGSQFADTSVAAAYAKRPPFPDAVFDVLTSLFPAGPQRVLELGCGSGDLTLRLAQRVDHVDAIEPSRAMLDIARARMPAGLGNVRWLQTTAEAFEPDGTYSLVVAAESLHWMEWSPVLAMIARALDERGVLAIVTERRLSELPWTERARELIARHSTNREYRAYDLTAELRRRGLFRESGRRECTQPSFTQSVDDYVESFHSRNGFSRERMSVESARAFDAALRDLVLAHAPDGVVSSAITAPVVWGRPVQAGTGGGQVL